MIERTVRKLISSQSKHDRECSQNNFENKQCQRTNIHGNKSKVLQYKKIENKTNKGGLTINSENVYSAW